MQAKRSLRLTVLATITLVLMWGLSGCLTERYTGLVHGSSLKPTTVADTPQAHPPSGATSDRPAQQEIVELQSKIFKLAKGQPSQAVTGMAKGKELVASYNVIGGYTPPSVLVAVVPGSSMSSISGRIAKTLLEAHGYRLCGFIHKWEVGHPDKNQFKTDENSMEDALALIERKAKQQNCTVVIKLESANLVTQMYATMGSDVFQDWEFVVLLRANFLDRLVTSTRDCFHEVGGFGIPVFPNGTKATQICFKRRKTGIRTLAKFIKLSETEKKLDELASHSTKAVTALHNVQKYTISKVATEDLTIFESDSSVGALQRSMAAWQSVLASWRVPSSPRVINQVFAKYGIGQRARPAPHSEVIYNHEDVQRTLGKHKYLWRPT